MIFARLLLVAAGAGGASLTREIAAAGGCGAVCGGFAPGDRSPQTCAALRLSGCHCGGGCGGRSLAGNASAACAGVVSSVDAASDAAVAATLALLPVWLDERCYAAIAALACGRAASSPRACNATCAAADAACAALTARFDASQRAWWHSAVAACWDDGGAGCEPVDASRAAVRPANCPEPLVGGVRGASFQRVDGSGCFLPCPTATFTRKGWKRFKRFYFACTGSTALFSLYTVVTFGVVRRDQPPILYYALGCAAFAVGNVASYALERALPGFEPLLCENRAKPTHAALAPCVVVGHWQVASSLWTSTWALLLCVRLWHVLVLKERLRGAAPTRAQRLFVGFVTSDAAQHAFVVGCVVVSAAAFGATNGVGSEFAKDFPICSPYLNPGSAPARENVTGTFIWAFWLGPMFATSFVGLGFMCHVLYVIARKPTTAVSPQHRAAPAAPPPGAETTRRSRFRKSVASIAAAAAKARASATPAIFDDPGFARKMGFAGTRVQIKSSTRLQCDRIRNVLRRAFSLCFENLMRAINPSKNQPNRLRCDRAREFQKFGRDVPNQRLICTQAGTPLVFIVLHCANMIFMFCCFAIAVDAMAQEAGSDAWERWIACLLEESYFDGDAGPCRGAPGGYPYSKVVLYFVFFGVGSAQGCACFFTFGLQRKSLDAWRAYVGEVRARRPRLDACLRGPRALIPRRVELPALTRAAKPGATVDVYDGDDVRVSENPMRLEEAAGGDEEAGDEGDEEAGAGGEGVLVDIPLDDTPRPSDDEAEPPPHAPPPDDAAPPPDDPPPAAAAPPEIESTPDDAAPPPDDPPPDDAAPPEDETAAPPADEAPDDDFARALDELAPPPDDAPPTEGAAAHDVMARALDELDAYDDKDPDHAAALVRPSQDASVV